MKVAVFDTHRFEQPLFEELRPRFSHQITFLETRLTEETALLARGFPAICCFANDRVNSKVLHLLKELGVKLIALRSAGFNHVDIPVAESLGIKVVRVPAYSPYAVAEHAVALILALNRKICKASSRVHELNFSLDGLVGFDLHGKTVGVVGTGRIGSVMTNIMKGFGCEVIAYDLNPNPELLKAGIRYVTFLELCRRSEIISLHLPLMPATRHLIDSEALAQMKKGVMLVNTGRGALIDTRALVDALKTGHVGAAGLDVYEEEENIFFHDLSEKVLQDDVLARLLTFPNVLITAHQAFLTHEALHNIVETTLQNIEDFEKGLALKNEVRIQK